MSWEDHAGLLKIIWVETGGPSVEKPVSRGFGTRSVIASIELQLGGRAEFDWRPEGLVCCLDSAAAATGVCRRAGFAAEAGVDGNGLRRAGR